MDTTDTLPPPAGEKLLTKADVKIRTGMGEVELWRKLNEGTFPRPRLRSTKRLAWLQSEIDAWMRNLPIAPKLTSPNHAPRRATAEDATA